ncbi:ferredoxin-thioredoxin reductase catalytic domain-containing protein [Clostridium sp.]|uniref:ferredoxin-thioredoxin reductase catalytic domain-containing protein n=1 Tax=Clostridium sp. TaxID=1506 RepID=UPI0026214268|nr:ferredoxin-thioredoxin reductase catalytic domain-containing protein [Clostridium sp.]
MKLNTNKEKVEEIRCKLKKNNGYCPCMIEQSEDTKCPCKPMRKEHKCICGLYIND